MPQSHPKTGPVRFLSPMRFLARKAEWRTRRNFTSVLSRGHIRLRTPYALARLYTYGLAEWCAGLHGYPVRCPYRHRAGPALESSMFSYPTRKGAVRHPKGHVRKLIQPELKKIPLGRRIWPCGARTGPLRSPHGLFRISKSVRGP